MNRWNALGHEARPSDLIQVALVDLDGCVFAGEKALPDSIDTLSELISRGISVCFVTNNASKTQQQVRDKLIGFGLKGDYDIMTASIGAARFVSTKLERGDKVLAVGGPGVVESLEAEGFNVVYSAYDKPRAVVQGYGADVGWPQLREAAHAIQNGAWWVATNMDTTLPTERGLAPGNGALVGAVQHTTDQKPYIVGKPESHLYDLVLADHPDSTAIAIGDRLGTDIAGAVNANIASLLVLTGVSTPLDLVNAHREERPTYVGATMAALFDKHPAATIEPDGARCGNATASVTANVLKGTSPDTEPDLNLLRASAVAAWSTADEGGHIHVEPHFHDRLMHMRTPS